MYDWGIVLISMAMSGNFFSQVFYYMYNHNSYSIVQFITSAILLVWGYNAIVNVNVMSNKNINLS